MAPKETEMAPKEIRLIPKVARMAPNPRRLQKRPAALGLDGRAPGHVARRGVELGGGATLAALLRLCCDFEVANPHTDCLGGGEARMAPKESQMAATEAAKISSMSCPSLLGLLTIS